MPEPIERGRTSVWEYVNPLAVVDRPLSAYTSPFAAVIYGPYSAMAAGRGITFPGVFPTLSGVPGIAGPARKVALETLTTTRRFLQANVPASIRNNIASRFIGGGAQGLLFGFTLTGSRATADARTLASAGSISEYLKVRSGARLERKAFAQAARSGLRGAGATTLLSSVDDVAAATIRIPGRLTIGTMGRSSLIHFGRIVSPVMNALAVAQIAYFGAEAAFKGITAVGDMIDRATERVHSLELGGELSRNFLTQGAATERQRALNAIQASHLSGRRFMGNEATILHQ